MVLHVNQCVDIVPPKKFIDYFFFFAQRCIKEHYVVLKLTKILFQSLGKLYMCNNALSSPLIYA